MRTIKKTIACLVAALMLLGTCSAAFTASATASGVCGDNLTWSYDESTATLTISGEGDMYDYTWYRSDETGGSETTAPWQPYNDTMETLIIESGVTSIGEFAFYHCFWLTSATIPYGVTSIGDNAFSYCELTSVNIPDSVTTIGNYAFDSCCHLEGVTIPDSVTTIGNYAFENCSLQRLIIPDSVAHIGEYAFYGCSSLMSVTLQSCDTTEIGDYAFLYCDDLESITIIPGDGITFGDNVFQGCASLTDVYFAGMQQEWDEKITIGSNNAPLLAATFHYISEPKTIRFGSYPQSKVTDEATLAALNALSLDWHSYGYYSGTGLYDDGEMTAKDFMRYADVDYNGAKYRAVYFDSYRPWRTCERNEAQFSYQPGNGYNINTVYWFRYDPLEWRLLDPVSGLVMCTSIIDSQPFNNYVRVGSIFIGGDATLYGDSAKRHYACDYVNSSLRQWLINDFYNTAFQEAEKSFIVPTTLDNSGCYTQIGQTGYENYDSDSTTDRIFLLSYSEAASPVYGFEEDELNFNRSAERVMSGSDYAMCQGLLISCVDQLFNVSSCWWLRSSADDSLHICTVDGEGGIVFEGVHETEIGVVPALRLSEIPTDEPEDTYSISVGDQVAVNLILDLDTRGLMVSDVSITMDGQPVETTVTNEGDQYRFTIITAPAQIADEIVITVGDETITTTVMDYCISLCGHEYDAYEKEQNLAKAILQYGKAANEVFDWTDEEITTFGELDHQPVQAYTGSIFTDGTHKITGASFMALAKPVFRFYMSGVSEAEAAAYNNANNITAAYSDPNLSESEQLNARFLKATRDDETFVLVEVTGISAENMNEEVVVSIPGLGQFTFNGNAFAKTMANDSDPVTQNFGAALYNYGAAANACFKPAIQEA
ncbi:MAG: leucine-rich repeat domain-containing protein [Clostridia bacterium]|nr:leucine-rich repeat domain-containing protein [Clostridia bacterium]